MRNSIIIKQNKIYCSNRKTKLSNIPHFLVLKSKFQTFESFTLLFSKKHFHGKKLTSKKERAKSKADSVQNSDGDKQSKVDSIILEKRTKFIFLIIFYLTKLLVKIKDL